MLTLGDGTVTLLLGTAAALASFHTLIGVDHSIPFIVLGRARAWSLRRTLGVTGACGLAHVASSVLIGSLGVLLGVTLAIRARSGDVAGPGVWEGGWS